MPNNVLENFLIRIELGYWDTRINFLLVFWGILRISFMKLNWCEDWVKLFPEANRHEIDMLNGKYGSYAKGSLKRQIEEGKYTFGTMT